MFIQDMSENTIPKPKLIKSKLINKKTPDF